MLRFSINVLSLVAFCFFTWSRPALAEEVDFARDVQPILSDNCYACHGPDEEDRSADLRLDTQEGVLSVIAKDDLANSEFLARLISSDPDEVMPPPDKKDPLSPQQIEILKTWIHSGAKWGRHWAFEQPVKKALPGGDEKQGHPVDAFVRKGLEGSGLSASPPARPETLLRRVSLDLTGLPPSMRELDAFLADKSPGAWDKAVNRLLDSPHFG